MLRPHSQIFYDLRFQIWYILLLLYTRIKEMVQADNNFANAKIGELSGGFANHDSIVPLKL